MQNTLNGAGFTDRWKLASENVLAVLMAEEAAFESTRSYDHAVFEHGLRAAHHPAGNHRAVMQTIIALRAKGTPVGAATVATAAVGVKEEWVYSVQATYNLTIDGAVFESNVAALLEFGEIARTRDSIADAQRDLSSGKDRNTVVMQLMQELSSGGDDIIINETAERAGAAFEKMLAVAPSKSFKTGIAPLDAWMGGIGEDDVIGIVAPQKSRKSSLARNPALNIVEQGGSVDILMLESNRTMVIALLVSMLAVRWLHREGLYDKRDQYGRPVRLINAKDLVRVRNGYRKWDATKVAAVDEGIRQFKSYGSRMRLFDKSREGGALTDLNSVKRILLRSKQKHGTDLALVDHLLALGGDGTVFDKMSEASQELETFARHEKMNLLLLAQMNEQSIRDGSGRRGSGVKGGGDFAAHCDYVFTVNYRGSLGGEPLADDLLKVAVEYSRYGEGGENVTSTLRIDPSSGFVFGEAEQRAS